MKSHSDRAYIGIDPGANGAIASITQEGDVRWWPLPLPREVDPDLIDLVVSAALVVTEPQQMRPTDTAQVGRLVAEAGKIEGWVTAVRGEEPRPMVAQTWRRWSQTVTSPGQTPEAYAARKRHAQARATELAGRHVPLRYADAVCIAEAARAVFPHLREEQ